MGGDERHTLSIVIPTYNERANIDPLFREFVQLKERLSNPFEIHIVDDGSPDGTGEVAYDLGQHYGLLVRVHFRTRTRGLGTAIVAGLSLSNSELVCVMDADLSHPPLLLPTLLERLNGFDAAVASRYTEGGRIASWSMHRRMISFVATKIAQHVLGTRCADPLSGFFLFRAESLRGLPMTGVGNKPLLEILGQNHIEVFEVPYEFRNRTAGESKLTIRAILEFVWLVLRLRRTHHRGVNLTERKNDETSAAPPDS